jgi:pimeloyl-ACP methyl ester carboxylesterase
MTALTNTTNATHTAQAPARKGRRAWRLLRGFARGLGVVLALILGLGLAGAAYEALAAGGDARTYPPPGRLVDVGGYQLHIQCVGAGSPTVVLDAGLGGTSLDWSLVQTAMGRTTQVCAYDRAGMGWSDPSPQPRTPGQIARELHTLLTNAGIPGPYVLVGHSLAGKNVRMFALQHPAEVAGMVLVDARSEYVDERTSPAAAEGFQQAMAAQESMYRLARVSGIARLFGASLWGTPGVPAATSATMALFSGKQSAVDATTAEARERAASDAELRAAPPLGALPLIVLASGQNMKQDADWPAAQRGQAALSTNGQLIVAEGSSHYIQFDQPALVIDAVRQVVAQVRGQ